MQIINLRYGKLWKNKKDYRRFFLKIAEDDGELKIENEKGSSQLQILLNYTTEYRIQLCEQSTCGIENYGRIKKISEENGELKINNGKLKM